MRVITIDGPAGAGKSTVARGVAAGLGWRLLDTGAMYRAVTLAALRRGVELECDEGLGRLADGLDVRLDDGGVWLDGEDVAAAIRTVEVTHASRHAADNPRVRARLVTWQRAFAAEGGTVTEGRDQGTIVFPDAPLKYFLTATPEERARRRCDELKARGEAIELAVVLRDINERDARDEARAIAPLKPAPDALTLDSTGMPVVAVVGRIVAEARARIGDS